MTKATVRGTEITGTFQQVYDLLEATGVTPRVEEYEHWEGCVKKEVRGEIPITGKIIPLRKGGWWSTSTTYITQWLTATDAAVGDVVYVQNTMDPQDGWYRKYEGMGFVCIVPAPAGTKVHESSSHGSDMDSVGSYNFVRCFMSTESALEAGIDPDLKGLLFKNAGEAIKIETQEGEIVIDGHAWPMLAEGRHNLAEKEFFFLQVRRHRDGRTITLSGWRNELFHFGGRYGSHSLKGVVVPSGEYLTAAVRCAGRRTKQGGGTLAGCAHKVLRSLKKAGVKTRA